MLADPLQAAESRWSIPAAISAAILDRRFDKAHCDAHSISQNFLPFQPHIAGFLEAAKRGMGLVHKASLRDAIFRFEEIDRATIMQVRPEDGEWFLMKNFAVASPRIGENYRSFCHILGKDDQAELTAYVHGAGVHAPRHTDLSGGLIVMLEGSREWRVEPPLHRGEGIFDPLHDLKWGEGFGAAIEPVTTLAGDAIYIPSGWWHEVRSLEPSMTLRIGIAERTVPSTN